MLLCWLLACVNPRPIVEVDVPVDTPPSAPVVAAGCVSDCVRSQQMAAEPIETITARCERVCAHPDVPLGAPTP
jgi:hypothetical protein